MRKDGRTLLTLEERLKLAEGSQAELDHPYRPAWGVRADNALVLLSLMLLDHARGRRRGKDIYHCKDS